MKETVILDFGSARDEDDLRDFRRGEGKYAAKISKAIDQLQDEGVVGEVRPILTSCTWKY